MSRMTDLVQPGFKLIPFPSNETASKTRVRDGPIFQTSAPSELIEPSYANETTMLEHQDVSLIEDARVIVPRQQAQGGAANESRRKEGRQTLASQHGEGQAAPGPTYSDFIDLQQDVRDQQDRAEARLRQEAREDRAEILNAISTSRSESRNDMATLQATIQSTRAELNAAIVSTRSELHADIAELRQKTDANTLHITRIVAGGLAAFAVLSLIVTILGIWSPWE